MKSLFSSCILIVFFALTTSCSIDDNPLPLDKEFPIPETLPAADIDPTGVTLSGKVQALGSQEAEWYVFRWLDNEQLFSVNIASSFKFLPVGPEGVIQGEKVEFRLGSNLQAGKVYYYSFGVSTVDNVTTYGDIQQFTAQGSLPPEITSLSRTFGYPSNSLQIFGIGLAHNPLGNEVEFGGVKAEVYGSNGEMILVRVPDMPAGEVEVRLTVGGQSTVWDGKFRVLE